MRSDCCARPSRARRARGRLLAEGYPAYTTTPGWLGYDDEKLVRLSRQAVADGFSLIKLKVGANRHDDRRRLALLRARCGPDVRIAIDANQVMGRRRSDRLGAAAALAGPVLDRGADRAGRRLGARGDPPRGRARSGSPPGSTRQPPSCSSRLLQAGAVDVVQIDACRVAESTRTSPSCCWRPSSACRSARTPAAWACARWSSIWRCSTTSPVSGVGRPHDRVRRPPARALRGPRHIRDGRYVAPRRTGGGRRMHPASVAEYSFPDGSEWRAGSPALSEHPARRANARCDLVGDQTFPSRTATRAPGAGEVRIDVAYAGSAAPTCTSCTARWMRASAPRRSSATRCPARSRRVGDGVTGWASATR